MQIYDSQDGPPLPDWFSLPATALFALLTLYLILRTPGRAARFLLFALSFRYALGGLQRYTMVEVLPGISGIALGSLATIGLGIFVLDKRRILARPFLPVLVIAGLMLVSGFVNQTLPLAFDPLLRFVFFVLTAVALWQALENNGSKVLRSLLFVFAQPLVFQIASIGLGVVKSGELDGSVSFIGGYHHEDFFSQILATCFIAAILAPRIDRLLRFGLAFVSAVGIYLANARTTILGLVPIAGAALLIAVPQAFVASQRKLVRIVVVVVGAALLVVGVATQRERFADVGLLAQGTAIIKPPEKFTQRERAVLNGRVFIWSQYIYGFASAPALQKAIGHGPDTWTLAFPKYAHNTLISFLYELGIAGVAAILFLWLSMLRLAMRASADRRTLLIACHVGFIILNQSGMPHWQIEGNILYGLLCGYTIAQARVAQARRATERSAPNHSSIMPRGMFGPAPR